MTNHRANLFGHVVLGCMLAVCLVSPGLVAEQRLYVHCNAGSLSMVLQDQLLTVVLETVARQCGIRMSYLGQVMPATVTATLPPMPVVEAMKRLLDTAGVQNYTMVSRRHPGEGNVRLARIIFLGTVDTDSPARTPQNIPAIASTQVSPAIDIVRVSKAEVTDLLQRPLELQATPTEVEVSGARKTSGLAIQQLGQGSLLEKAGLRPGDVILDVNGVRTDTQEALAQALQHSKDTQGGTFRFLIARDGAIITAYLMGEVQ